MGQIDATWHASPVADPHFIQQDTGSPASTNILFPGSASPSGLTPTQVRDAYGVGGISFNGVTGDGSGQTVAIVDAYDDPTIATDLHHFDQYYDLPDPPSFEKLNQNGGTTLPGTDPDGPCDTTGDQTWEEEESLDVEWAHVIAPDARIILFEANDDTSVLTAVATARMIPGVTVVSMSWGGQEFSGQAQSDAQYFTTPANHIGAGGVAGGITFVAATGDSGAYDPDTGSPGVEYPASSPDVLSVGGTTLNVNGNAYAGETGWYSGGGGVSSEEPQPSWQKGIVTQSTSRRTVPDVSMDADPSTGVPIFDSYDFGASTPWSPGYEGGTSLATPMWAGLVAIADQGRASNGLGSLDGATQTLPTLYKLPAADFHDVITGNNGYYYAGKGYDLVTGRGSPVANLLVPGLAAVATPAAAPSRPVIASLTAAPTRVISGRSLTLTARGVTDTTIGRRISSVTFYRESNGTSGLQTSGNKSDPFIGTATAGSGGDWSITIPTAGLAAGTFTFYAVATDNVGLTSNAVSTTAVVTPAATAAYVGIDYNTEGNWKGVYGSQGEYIVNDSGSLPSYASLTYSGSAATYEASTAALPALQRKTSGRIASALTGSGSVSLNLNLRDGQFHRIDLYLLDWKGKSASSEKVSVLDAITGAVLSSQTISSYSLGKYVAFNVSGNVTVKIAAIGGGDASVSGVFVDP